MLGVTKMALHDPLAVGVALDHSLVTAASGPVHVETQGEFTRGQTVHELKGGDYLILGDQEKVPGERCFH